jgi:cell division protein FtsW (lipid II flippase)
MKNKRIRKTRSTVFGQDIGSRRHRPDYALGIISLVLLAIGLVVVYAMSPGLSTLAQVADTHFIYRQMIAIGLAFVSFIVFFSSTFYILAIISPTSNSSNGAYLVSNTVYR